MELCEDGALDEVALKQIIESSAADADAALRAAVDPEVGLAAFRAVVGGTPATLPAELLKFLTERGKLASFQAALDARQAPRAVDSFADNNLDEVAAAEFFARRAGSRCRIEIDGKVVGSGCVIGPTLVLTAAHVLTLDPAAVEFMNVEVIFSDGRREAVAARPVELAQVSPFDLPDQAPDSSADYAEDHDYALLRLARPSGSRYYNVPLPTNCWRGSIGATIFVAHYPNGTDRGIGPGQLLSISDPDARWRHDVVTAPGSSGGPCFNNKFDLIGLHQGQWPPSRRLVPISLSIKKLRKWVAEDRTPPFLWSLTGDLSGDLVIGRDDLFEAFSHMANRRTRLRGLRVRRLRPEGSDMGLGFTVQILQALIERNAAEHRLLYYDWPMPPAPGFDFLADFEQRVLRAGWLSGASKSDANDGVRLGETGRASAVQARAECLAQTLHAAAEQQAKTSWLVFGNAAGTLGEAREALEALIRAVLVWPDLRVVMIGLETLGTPGDEFDFAAASTLSSEGSGAFLVEWFGEFSRTNLIETLRRSGNAAGKPQPDSVLSNMADVILDGIPEQAGYYTVDALPEVSRLVRQQVRPWFGDE